MRKNARTIVAASARPRALQASAMETDTIAAGNGVFTLLGHGYNRDHA